MSRLLLIGIFLAGLLLAGFPGGAAQPAAAQGGSIWTAQFYNNTILLGDPAYTASYQNISFDWGNGSPAAEVKADNFSARFATDAFFEAGTYRFFMLADDAVQLWVDFPPDKQPEISTFGAPVPGQLVTIDITMTAGVHHIQVDFRENGGLAYLRVDWANLATNPTGPSFPTPITAPTVWTAQYYPNASLSGFASLTQNENTPTHDWGASAPAAGFPADNFSVRWSSFPTLNPGTYQISVRADDGVRVFVDGVPLINEFHTATGQTYTASFTVPQTSQRNIVVEYFEGAGLASLVFNFTQSGQSGGGTVNPPAAPSSPTGAFATVTTFRLNVRSGPGLNFDILTKIDRGQTYPVLGRNADSSWWEIQVGNIIGWVSAPFVSVTNGQTVPVGDGQIVDVIPDQPTIPGGPTATVLSARLNVRSGPGLNFDILTAVEFGDTYPIVGRNANSSWWQINVNGLIGWVSGALIAVDNEQQVPVTG